MNVVKTVVVDDKDGKGKRIKRKFILQTDGTQTIFREHVLSGYQPIPLPEGTEVIFKKPKDGRIAIPYIRKIK